MRVVTYSQHSGLVGWGVPSSSRVDESFRVRLPQQPTVFGRRVPLIPTSGVLFVFGLVCNFVDAIGVTCKKDCVVFTCSGGDRAPSSFYHVLGVPHDLFAFFVLFFCFSLFILCLHDLVVRHLRCCIDGVCVLFFWEILSLLFVCVFFSFFYFLSSWWVGSAPSLLCRRCLRPILLANSRLAFLYSVIMSSR